MKQKSSGNKCLSLHGQLFTSYLQGRRNPSRWNQNKTKHAAVLKMQDRNYVYEKKIFWLFVCEKKQHFFTCTWTDIEPRSRRTEGETKEYLKVICSKIANILLTPVLERVFQAVISAHLFPHIKKIKINIKECYQSSKCCNICI